MITILLEDVRSVYNVGSIFRTMEGFGFTEAALIGITPTPLDKRGTPRKDFHKTALGAEDRIHWKYYDSTESFLEQNPGTVLVSVEITDASKDISEISHNISNSSNIAIIFGSEVDGVQKTTLEKSTSVYHVPMHGSKESFNVSVTAGIVLYLLKNSL